MPDAATTSKAGGSAVADRNEVVLVGRVAAPAVERELPSGDLLVSWRLVVRRPAEGAGVHATVDTLDCAALPAPLRRAALRWQPGDVVEVQGAVRRRFWRGATGPTSRYEIAVRAARRLLKAQADAGRGRSRA